MQQFLELIFSYIKLQKEIFNDQHKVNLTAITLSFLFLIQFFFLTFAYGLIPGFFSSDSWSFYLFAAVRTKKWKDMILSSIFLMLSSTYEEEFYYCTGSVSLLSFFTLFKRTYKNILKMMVLFVIVFVAGKMIMTVGFEVATGKKDK